MDVASFDFGKQLSCDPRTILCMATEGDFTLALHELRAVTTFVLFSACEVLPLFREAVPNDPRPREALDAATEFAEGGARGKRLRIASIAAHRAAAEAPTEVARLAARSAGDAASSAYLHPIAQASQVGHILRATASAARIAELAQGSADAVITRACKDASPVLIDVLSRYPQAPQSNSRTGQLMADLDRRLRATRR